MRLIKQHHSGTKTGANLSQYWGSPLHSSHHAPGVPGLFRLDVVLYTITGPPCVNNRCSYLCFSQVVHLLSHRQGLHVCAQITTSENTGRGLLADFWNFLWVATCPTLYCFTNPNDLDLPKFSALSSGSSWVFLSQSHLEILVRHCVSEAVVDLNVFTSSWGSLFFIVKCPVSWAGEMRKCSELWEMGNKLRPEFVTHSTRIKGPSMVSCACHSSIEGQRRTNL